ncbi:type II toxin-antitoxin system RelE/ParE family toxin [Candidatus Symbiothrix dinenymphae]|uniref:type II toxin-antitoxin system RelE/ParE family toxin n=1 Tax=Candidatus Symbiothrix dinenymphae TaxID=467085 RepID=UPI000AB3FCE1|nr:type II toxin-antitoxin system RelE/ParE family toxin [Candidatus Symbiothrix dinenymphae]
MAIEIIPSDKFKRSFRQLYKKYRSLTVDYEEFEKELRENPKLGDDLGGGYRKMRMAIQSKNKGKSGGARIITYELCLKTTENTIVLVDIYDKNERETMQEWEYKTTLQDFFQNDATAFPI